MLTKPNLSCYLENHPAVRRHTDSKKTYLLYIIISMILFTNIICYRNIVTLRSLVFLAFHTVTQYRARISVFIKRGRGVKFVKLLQ